MRVKAIIKEYNGGRYGKMGEYVAIVEPKVSANGQMLKTGFTLIERLETIKKGYRVNGNAAHTESIYKVIEEVK